MITAKDNIVYGGDVVESPTKGFRSVGHFALEQFKRYGDKKLVVCSLHILCFLLIMCLNTDIYIVFLNYTLI